MKAVHWVVFLVLAVGGGKAVYDLTRPRAPTLVFDIQGTQAVTYGTTDEYSYNVLDKLLDDHPEVDTLVLQQMPGTKDMVTNTRVVRGIRRAGLNTHVPSDGRIASGAVDWFIAGQTRTIDCGAMIGVHSWGNPLGGRGDQTLFDPQASMQRDFLKDMGVDPDFYQFTREAAGPDDIHWLSVEEMLRFGLLATAPKCE